MTQLKEGKKEQILSYPAFGFIQALDGLDGATHMREDNQLYSVH